MALTAAPAPRRDGLLLALAALLLYVLLGQRVFYKTDGPDLVWLLHQDNLHHPWHVGYLPVMALLRWCLEWTGISLLRLGELFSACGVAVAVLALHSAQRVLGTSRQQAAFAALLLALSPGCLLFATVVEFHGPMLGMATASMWWTARMAVRPTVAGMALLGVLTHGAFLLHGSAVLLPALLLPWFLALRMREGLQRRDLALAFLAGAVHSLLFLLLPKVWPSFYGDYADLAGAAQREGSIGRPQSLDYTPRILLLEWLLPLLPLSVAFLPALRRRELRLETVALLLGLLPFLYVCVRQLVFEPEYGAYMLPLLPLCARLTAAVWSRPWLWAMVLLSGAGGIWHVLHLESQGLIGQLAWRKELGEAAAGAEPYALLDTHRELCWAFATLEAGHGPADPRSQFLYVRPVAMSPRATFVPAHLERAMQHLLERRRSGRALLITTDTIRALEDPFAEAKSEKATVAVPPSEEVCGPLYLAALRERFVFVATGPRTYRLEPR